MPWEAKALMPSGSGPEALHGAFEDAAGGGITVLAAPSGNVLTEGLASALTRLGRHPLWLRVSPGDRDPGAFLVSVVAAAQRSWRDAGRGTLRSMKARPGPVFGWAPLFAELARELRAAMAGHGALVLEDAHHAWAGCPTLALAGADLLPELDGVLPCVLLAHHAPRSAPLGNCTQRPGGDLRLPAQAVERTLGEYAPTLTRKERERAVTLIGGRAAVVAGLRHIHQTPGGHLTALLQRSASWEELLARCAQAILAGADSEARRALALAMRVGYTQDTTRCTRRRNGSARLAPTRRRSRCTPRSATLTAPRGWWRAGQPPWWTSANGPRWRAGSLPCPTKRLPPTRI